VIIDRLFCVSAFVLVFGCRSLYSVMPDVEAASLQRTGVFWLLSCYSNACLV
jgi:hypothetical protein